MKKYLAVFVGLLLVFSLLYNLDPVQERALKPWNHALASASYAAIRTVDDEATLTGNILANQGRGFSVAVENDCNGLEATLLLLCAVLAFPSGWKAKAVGLVLGIAAVQGLNLVRIVSLFYLGQWNESVFNWTHKYLWPVLIIVAALAVFVAWMRYLAAPPAPASPQA